MTSRRISVFFYGLFMDDELLRAKGVQPTGPQHASVRGFALRIGERATLVPDVDERAYGVLMELSHEEIERLYSEPSVKMYRPEAVIAELADGIEVPALCFNLPGLSPKDRTTPTRRSCETWLGVSGCRQSTSI